VQAGFAIGSPGSRDAKRHKRPAKSLLGYRRLDCDIDLFGPRTLTS